MIATPTMGEVSIQFTEALANMILMTSCPIEMATVIRKMHHRARTELAEKFLASDCSHILFLDDDNIPKPHDLNKLLELNLPIVSGLYFRRIPPFEPIIILENDGSMERRPDLYRSGDKTPFKVHSTGMGFILIKREVIEKVKALGVPLFDVRGNIGEDIWFCLQVNTAGYYIMCAPDVEVGHLGEKTMITGETYMDYYEKNIMGLVKEAETVDGWQSFQELHVLAEAASMSELVIEVGSYKGRSATVLSLAKRVVCVDLWAEDGEYKWDQDVWDNVFSKFMKVEEKYPNIQHLRGNSNDLAGNFPEESADMIFIDGGHVYEQVKKDIENYLPKLKRNGKMYFHDYIYPEYGVKQAIDEYLDNHKYEIKGRQVSGTSLYEFIKL